MSSLLGFCDVSFNSNELIKTIKGLLQKHTEDGDQELKKHHLFIFTYGENDDNNYKYKN
jgi:hypothetical protein